MHDIIHELIATRKFYKVIIQNGFQLNLRILDCDEEKIFAEDPNGHKKLIYKHAISTIELD